MNTRIVLVDQYGNPLLLGDPSGLTTPIVSYVGGLITWIEGGDLGGGGSGSIYTDTITGDGAEDTFTLTNTPVDSWALVSANGAQLLPTEFAISGSDVVFDTPPDNGSEVLVTYVFDGGMGGGSSAPSFLSVSKWGVD